MRFPLWTRSSFPTFKFFFFRFERETPDWQGGRSRPSAVAQGDGLALLDLLRPPAPGPWPPSGVGFLRPMLSGGALAIQPNPPQTPRLSPSPSCPLQPGSPVPCS